MGICKRLFVPGALKLTPIARLRPTTAFVRLQRDTPARQAGVESVPFVIRANSK